MFLLHINVSLPLSSSLALSLKINNLFFLSVFASLLTGIWSRRICIVDRVCWTLGSGFVYINTFIQKYYVNTTFIHIYI